MADAPDVLNEHGEFGEDRSVMERSKATGAARAEAISAEKAEPRGATTSVGLGGSIESGAPRIWLLTVSPGKRQLSLR